MKFDRPWRLAIYGILAAFFWLATVTNAVGALQGYEDSFVVMSVYLALSLITTSLALMTFPRVREYMEASA